MEKDSPGRRIGRNLRAMREARMMSRPTLAERAGVGVATVDHIERGLSARPRRTTLEKLAGPLGVSVERLIDGATRPLPKLDLAPMYEASRQDRERALRAASDEERERYLNQIDAAMQSAERAIAEAEDEMLPDPPPNPHPRVVLMRHAQILGMLRGEALFYAPHAGVAEIEYPPALPLGA